MKIKVGINADIDPSKVPYECMLDGCSIHRPREYMHSFVFSYATPGLERNSDGTIKNMYPGFSSDQLYACCHDHMIQLLKEYAEHFEDFHEEGVHYAPLPGTFGSEKYQEWLKQLKNHLSLLPTD